VARARAADDRGRRITRLTESGLSITAGAGVWGGPPLSERAWQAGSISTASPNTVRSLPHVRWPVQIIYLWNSSTGCWTADRPRLCLAAARFAVKRAIPPAMAGS
jgi:hypothetical protein